MSGVPAVPGTGELSACVAAVFADEGPLARALRGFEPRDGQRVMADAVCAAFDAGAILLAQAGTGTGKTLAYLIPALLSGHRVLVSTGTKHLQEQILEKDLPLIERALGRRVRAACMKGRANYVCLQRLERASAAAAPGPGGESALLAVLDDWVSRTGTGDRAELADLPDEMPFWDEISASVDNCVGAECPLLDTCFITRMRQRAQDADLVVVNHHLLCADAAVRHHSLGEVIPECRFTVVDEAHQLEDVATQYFGVTVSTRRFDELTRDLERLIASRAVQDPEQTEGLLRAAGHVAQHARALFAQLSRAAHGDAAATQARDATSPPTRTGLPAQGGLFDDRVRLSRAMVAASGEHALGLLGALEGLAAAVALVKEAPEDVRALGSRATALAADLRFVWRADDEAFVYVLETRGRGMFLRAMPIDVSAFVRESILERSRSTVLTSATLAVNGSFEYVRSRLGIGDALEIELPSEFDFRSQAILYLPRRMPDPRAPGFAEAAAREVVEILARSQGRAFVLFTSYGMMRQVQALVEPLVPYPVLAQGTAPRRALLEAFRVTSNAVLFATSSFWQGVDVVGDALSCVIIDKLPFASPGDPLIAARMEAIAARGEDAFNSYQVPLAILTLLQGLGRLIRHRLDRGVLAVLDPRLRTMGYGRRFLAALPPAPVTHSLDDVARFFGE